MYIHVFGGSNTVIFAVTRAVSDVMSMYPKDVDFIKIRASFAYHNVWYKHTS